MAREVSQTTQELRNLMDSFLAEFEEEFRSQSTKTNRSSERRMRKLLRSFPVRVYEPYRDGTLPSRAEEEPTQTPF